MKLAIDCRYIGKSGIGRVCEGLLGALDFSEHEYFLIGKRDALANYPAHIVEDDTDPYTPEGLRSFDRRLNKTCDALIIPNFLVPFGIRIPVYTVMHDLAFLDVRETTRGTMDRMIKKTLLKRCMRKSAAVSCVSEFTLSRCEHHFRSLSKKCFVNYNGLSKSVWDYAKTHPLPQKENTAVFVGNVKPHKGLPLLLSAFSKCKKGMILKVIGEKDSFLTGLQLDEAAYPNVVFTGKLGDDELFAEIARATYLVLPSKYEGFGFPPLEALVLGTQPIVFELQVFREVYDGLPVKFFRTERGLSELLDSRPDPIGVDYREEIAARYDFRKCVENLLSRIAL